IKRMCGREVPLDSGDPPQVIEHIADVDRRSQRLVERQALLEEGAGGRSIPLLEVPQSQAIERPGDRLLVALLPQQRQALLEPRANPGILALVGVPEGRERKGYE